MPGFEVYLQFDSLDARAAARPARGRPAPTSTRKALDRLNEHNISTTLVVTLKKGLNDDEIGEIIDFALKQRCVRGVTFQPIQDAGRVESFDPATDRLTLGEVRQQHPRSSHSRLPAEGRHPGALPSRLPGDGATR